MTPWPSGREAHARRRRNPLHPRGVSTSDHEGSLVMRRILVVLIVGCASLALAVPVALAASPHFKKGGEPVCTFSGTTSIPVTCTGTLAGLGNEDLNLHLSVSGSALYQCQNGGGNLAPGQNKVLE